MAQKTFTALSVLTASDLNTYLMHEGGAWTSFSPTVTQSVGVTFTNNYSKYARSGRMITWSFSLTMTSAGTAANNVVVSVPVAATSTTALAGSGSVYDASVTTNYSGALAGLSVTTVIFVGDWSGSGGWGFSPNLALAIGDVLYGSITYEAAT